MEIELVLGLLEGGGRDPFSRSFLGAMSSLGAISFLGEMSFLGGGVLLVTGICYFTEALSLSRVAVKLVFCQVETDK